MRVVFFSPFLSSCEFSDVSSAQQTLLGLKELFEEKAVYFCCCLLPFIISNPIFLFIFFYFPPHRPVLLSGSGQGAVAEAASRKARLQNPQEHLPSCSKGHPRLPKPPLG